MRRPSAALVAAASAAVLVVPLVSSASAAPRPTPTYTPYATGLSVGEPSIGYDLKANAAIYGAGKKNVRMTWDDRVRPAKVTVVDATAPTSVTSLDAITFTDQQTSRTFVSQLAGVCSLFSFSDDAGRNYTPSQGCGVNTLLDHQTVGGGPYTKTLPTGARLTGYRNAVYYCAQNGFSSTCARSDNGGLTFGAGVPTYNTPANGGTKGGACSAIHGHLRVGPDGTAYLPNKGCGGTLTAGNLTNSEFFGGGPALSVSEDNGGSWVVRQVPGAHNQDESDPSVAADKGGLVYFGWEDGTNPSETTFGSTSSARIAVTSDHGKTWSKPYDVSSSLGLHNVQFPEVIAGGPGRAAFSFIGTPGTGDDQHNGFVGEWHLYIATTQDSGRSWTTVDTTPKDPVQRGCISLQGTSNKNATDGNLCKQRNLLDFNDITVDKLGRVLVAYSDGCAGTCVTDVKSASKGAVDMVMRQTTGPFLYAAAVDKPTVARPSSHLPGGGIPGSSSTSRGTATSAGIAAGTSSSSGLLAATGANPMLAAGALVLLGVGGVLRRRRRSA